MSPDMIRHLTAGACFLAGIWLHYAGSVDFGLGLFLWLGLAAGMGYFIAQPWVVVFAPLPWILGIGAGVLSGRYDDFGEGWFVSFILSTIAGIIGMILGAAIRGNRRDPTA